MAGGFDHRKAIGTRAETLLRELLTDSGAIVTAHQQNYDATREQGGAAMAYGAGGRPYHIPDIEARWPNRALSRCFIEAKAKEPLKIGGGWGLDTHAFKRAWQWMRVSGEPVFYAIRDLSRAPLPPACGDDDFRDDPALWSIASMWKLMYSDFRVDDGAFHYWPAADFMPLQMLLDGAFAVQPVPYLTHGMVGTPSVPRLF